MKHSIVSLEVYSLSEMIFWPFNGLKEQLQNTDN